MATMAGGATTADGAITIAMNIFAVKVSATTGAGAVTGVGTAKAASADVMETTGKAAGMAAGSAAAKASTEVAADIVAAKASMATTVANSTAAGREATAEASLTVAATMGVVAGKFESFFLSHFNGWQLRLPAVFFFISFEFEPKSKAKGFNTENTEGTEKIRNRAA
jgi:hypothetical protein